MCGRGFMPGGRCMSVHRFKCSSGPNFWLNSHLNRTQTCTGPFLNADRGRSSAVWPPGLPGTQSRLVFITMGGALESRMISSSVYPSSCHSGGHAPSDGEAYCVGGLGVRDAAQTCWCFAQAQWEWGRAHTAQGTFTGLPCCLPLSISCSQLLAPADWRGFDTNTRPAHSHTHHLPAGCRDVRLACIITLQIKVKITDLNKIHCHAHLYHIGYFTMLSISLLCLKFDFWKDSHINYLYD